jgi:hypothetical protein
MGPGVRRDDDGFVARALPIFNVAGSAAVHIDAVKLFLASPAEHERTMSWSAATF